MAVPIVIERVFENAVTHYGEKPYDERSEREPGTDAQLFSHKASAIEGILSGSNGAGVSSGVAPVADAADMRGTDKERDRAKKRDAHHNTNMMVAMLNDAQALSDRLGRDIAGMEAGFEAKYGDAWREVIANDVFGADEVPQRRDGESMADYRERLEDELVAKMIDPETGEIRPEYADDPRYAEYAKWAKAQFEKSNADHFIDVYNDPNSTQEQVDAAAGKLNYNEGRQADRTLVAQADKQSPTSKVIAEASDGNRDQTAEVSSASGGAAAFGMGPG